MDAVSTPNLESFARCLTTNDRLMRAKELGELERQEREIDGLILDLSGDLVAARKARDRLYQGIDEGMQRVEERFADWEARKQTEQEHQRQEQAKADKQEREWRVDQLSEIQQLGRPKSRSMPSVNLGL